MALQVGGGDLNWVAQLDTSSFQQSLNLLNKELEQSLSSHIQLQQKAASAESAYAKSVLSALSSKAAAIEKIKEAYKGLSDADKANADIGGRMLANVEALEAELKQVAQTFLTIGKTATGSLDQKVGILQRLKAEYSALSEADRNSNIGKNLAANIKGLDKEIHQVNKEISDTDTLANKAALALGAYFSLTAAKDFVGDVVRVRGEFQQLEVAFQTMLGNKAKADKLMAEITEFAATTPFELSDVAAASKSLLAFGVEADKIKTTLRSIGDISAGVGAPIGEIAEIFGKAKVQGRLFAEDINQLTGRGIPVIQELAKQFGVTDDKVKGLVESGKVGFPQLEKAFQDLTGAGSKFGGLMEAQSHTLTGQLSNLSDAWNQMLNNIGKSNEGLLSGAIGIASSLVSNYQKVLDILGVLVITYGAYKAAVILTTAVESASAAAKAVLIARGVAVNSMNILQTATTTVLATAIRTLHTTMLANPAALVVAGIAALVSAYVLLKDKAIEVKSSQELLADAQKGIGDRMAEAESKILPYLEALDNANLSEDRRLEIYNKLKEIDPKIVQGLDAKTIGYKNLKNNVDLYLESLRNQVEQESRSTATLGSIKQENEFKAKIKELKAGIKETKAQLSSLADADFASETREGLEATILSAEKRLAAYEAVLKKQRDITKKISQGGVLDEDAASGGTFIKPKDTVITKAPVRNEAFLEAEIKRLKDLRAPLAIASKEYKDFTDQIEKLQKELNPSKVAKAQQTEENKVNAILKERVGIIESIQALQRDAKQSGLVKEQSELDKINEKYEKAFKNIDEYNKKVSDFNRKNKTNVQGIGLTDINALKAARDAEISNTQSKQDAEKFIKNLDVQRSAFEQYEEAKKKIGIEKANEMYASQRQGFEDYITFLKAQADDISPRIKLGVSNVGDQLKFDALNKEIADAERKQSEMAFKQKVEDLKRLFSETATFNQKRGALEEQFQKEAALIREKFSGQELVDRMKVLREKYNMEENELKASLVRQSAAFKALGADLFLLNEKDLKENAAKINKAIKDGFVEVDRGNGIKELVTLTPEMLQSLQAGVDKVEALRKAAEKAKILKDVFGTSSEKLNEMAGAAQDAAAIFSTISEALAPVSPQLSEIASQLADMANLMSNVFSSLAKGDWVGAIVATIGAMVKTLVDAKKSATEAKKAVEDFYKAIQLGELDAAIATRQRMLVEAEAHELTLERLAAQKKALDENKKANQDQSAALLKQLQQEQFIAGEQAKKGHGSLLFGAVGWLTGLGGKTKVEQELKSLAGMTFDQIEKLFNSGQLTDKAKELFEQLQKLKQEGVDIDKQLADLKRETQELFTGSTASGITDSIVDGFANGKRTVQDFANDTEDIIRKALLQALKFQALEGPIQKLFEQFAADAESGGVLDTTEISNFTASINKTIEDAAKFAEQIEKATGINLGKATGATGQANSLQGAIKGITEQQADLLAGQFGGLRLTAIEQLSIAKQGLDFQMRIENNTALTVSRLDALLRKFDNYESGAAKISIR